MFGGGLTWDSIRDSLPVHTDYQSLRPYRVMQGEISEGPLSGVASAVGGFFDSDSGTIAGFTHIVKQWGDVTLAIPSVVSIPVTIGDSAKK